MDSVDRGSAETRPVMAGLVAQGCAVRGCSLRRRHAEQRMGSLVAADYSHAPAVNSLAASHRNSRLVARRTLAQVARLVARRTLARLVAVYSQAAVARNLAALWHKPAGLSRRRPAGL